MIRSARTPLFNSELLDLTQISVNGEVFDTLPPGPAGPVGPAGTAGAVGKTGPTGATGAVGAPGAVGPVGAVGPGGAAGAAGAVGNTGPTGATGAPGAVGPGGAAGAVGAVGKTGPTGSSGLTGPTGPGGLPGPAGSTGPPGAAGPPGPTLYPRVVISTTTTGYYQSQAETVWRTCLNASTAKDMLLRFTPQFSSSLVRLTCHFWYQGAANGVSLFSFFRLGTTFADIVEVSGGTGLGMYTPTTVPYQTRVSFSWIANPKTVQQISYVIGLKNTPASTLILLGSNSAGPQLFTIVCVTRNDFICKTLKPPKPSKFRNFQPKCYV